LTQARSCFLALKIMSFARVGRPLAPDVLEEKRTTAADARRRQTHDGGGGGGRADGGGFDENRVREHVLECGPCLPLPARSTPPGALVFGGGRVEGMSRVCYVPTVVMSDFHRLRRRMCRRLRRRCRSNVSPGAQGVQGEDRHLRERVSEDQGRNGRERRQRSHPEDRLPGRYTRRVRCCCCYFTFSCRRC
jgi:hypothetical protein